MIALLKMLGIAFVLMTLWGAVNDERRRQKREFQDALDRREREMERWRAGERSTLPLGVDRCP